MRIPKANIIKPRKNTDFVKGILTTIPYEIIREDADWSEDFGTYEPQRYGIWDSNSCWCLSGINGIEDQCDLFKRLGKFPIQYLNWFKDNGYLDENDNFAFSERYIEILSGVKSNGNFQWTFWELVNTHGLLPRKDLNYMISVPQESSRQAFDAKYFDKSLITETMRAKALKALDYIQISYQWIGEYPGKMPSLDDIRHALKQSPLQIGVPVCIDTWNYGKVKYCGSKEADHAVELYKIGDDGTFYIFDQYEPHLKTLSSDYYIPYITQGVVSIVPERPRADWTHAFAFDLDFGDYGEEIKNLQRALVKLGYLEPKYITGNYLNLTANAVLRFQIDKKVAWLPIIFWYGGHHFNIKSRMAMNRVFNIVV